MLVYQRVMQYDESMCHYRHNFFSAGRSSESPVWPGCRQPGADCLSALNHGMTTRIVEVFTVLTKWLVTLLQNHAYTNNWNGSLICIRSVWMKSEQCQMIPEFLRHVFLLQGFLVHRVEYLKIILQVYKDIMYYNVYIYIYILHYNI